MDLNLKTGLGCGSCEAAVSSCDVDLGGLQQEGTATD